MKKSALFVCVLVLLFVVATSSKPKHVRKTVVYSSSIDCKNCETKVMDNISFEKGVKDVEVDLGKRTVTVVFDETRTDTLTLAKAIRKLGYSAKVIRYE